MAVSISAKADTVSTFRYTSVFLMETLARWVPTTPEMEAKALFGRHIWDMAQHADQLGRRTHELRAALHNSRSPVPEYHEFLTKLEGIADTAGRIGAFYDAVLPDLDKRYRECLASVDPLVDEPTVRIIERALSDFERMRADRDAVIAERPELTEGAQARSEMAALASAVEDFVDYRGQGE